MSLHDYQQSKYASAVYGFYALLMAAMRNADSDNAQKLRDAFPETWAELQARYNAPGGVIPECKLIAYYNWQGRIYVYPTLIWFAIPHGEAWHIR